VLGGAQRRPGVFDPLSVLANCPLFRGCSPAFFQELLAHGGDRAQRGTLLDSGRDVVKAGSPCSSLYIVYHGALEVIRPQRGDADGGDGLGAGAALLQEGDYFGQGCFDGSQTYHEATIRTATLCHLFEVTLTAYTEALMKLPQDRRLLLAAARRRRPKVAAPSPPAKKLDAGPAPLPAAKTLEAGRASCVETAASAMVRLRASGLVPRPPRESMLVPKAKEASAKEELGGPGGVTPVWWKRSDLRHRATTAEDEAYIARMKASLKHDVRNGFLILADFTVPALFGAQRSGRGGGRSPRMSASHAAKSEDPQAVEVPLDVGLLPPISTMSPMQKRQVQRQLEVRVHARRRFRVATRALRTDHRLAVIATGARSRQDTFA